MSSFTESLTGWGLIAWQLVLWSTVVGAWAFPIAYAIGSPWRSTSMGRHAMAFSVAVAYAVSAYALRFALGDFPGRALIMFSALPWLGVTVWWRLGIYVGVRICKRRAARGAVAALPRQGGK